MSLLSISIVELLKIISFHEYKFALMNFSKFKTSQLTREFKFTHYSEDVLWINNRTILIFTLEVLNDDRKSEIKMFIVTNIGRVKYIYEP